MQTVTLFIKSYLPDIALTQRLVASIDEHNPERLPVFVSVPADELAVFEVALSDFAGVSVVSDELFDVPALEGRVRLPRPNGRVWEFPAGYVRQQMIKLSVERLGAARNYVVLDSDTYFIRDFGAKDFVSPSGIGFAVATADNDLYADPAYAPFKAGRQERIDLIGQRLGIAPHERATCHNNAVFQEEVLARLHDWRRAEGLSLLDLMTIAPLEFTWYQFFLAKHCPERLVRVEPFIKMLHTRSEYRRLVRAGFTHQTLRSSYMGVCINSGWCGVNQGRYVERLDRGSVVARVTIRADEMRRTLPRELRYLYDSRVGQPLSCVPRLLRRGAGRGRSS